MPRSVRASRKNGKMARSSSASRQASLARSTSWPHSSWVVGSASGLLRRAVSSRPTEAKRAQGSSATSPRVSRRPTNYGAGRSVPDHRQAHSPLTRRLSGFRPVPLAPPWLCRCSTASSNPTRRGLTYGAQSVAPGVIRVESTRLASRPASSSMSARSRRLTWPVPTNASTSWPRVLQDAGWTRAWSRTRLPLWAKLAFLAAPAGRVLTRSRARGSPGVAAGALGRPGAAAPARLPFRLAPVPAFDRQPGPALPADRSRLSRLRAHPHPGGLHLPLRATGGRHRGLPPEQLAGWLRCGDVPCSTSVPSVGFRPAPSHPERVVRAGRAERERLPRVCRMRPRDFIAFTPGTPGAESTILDLFTLAATRAPVRGAGTADPALVAPEGWLPDQYFLDQPGRKQANCPVSPTPTRAPSTLYPAPAGVAAKSTACPRRSPGEPATRSSPSPEPAPT